MGVQNLWSILSPVQFHKNLSELKGQLLAVDLSIWVCESQGVKQMQAVVLKPFLRNLFFRITNLTQLGIKLVFVIEGEAPELKCETMMKRQGRHKQGQRGAAPSKSKQTGRRHFKARLKECCEMLDYLGIPWVQSKGEAEAMCAFLNANGLVDACITQDGDAFLYGARVVYRNFTLNTKDPHIDCYRMDDIEIKLKLNQNRLVGLGILLGCDFIPKGVPGVGKEGAMKLMNALEDKVDVLQRFKEWYQGFPFQSAAEKDVVRKAMKVPGFPNQAVIDEFLVPKDKFPKQPFIWARPSLRKIKGYNLTKLDWPEEYTEEKVLPMLTSHDMNQIIKYGIENCTKCLKPVEIVKTRVRQGIQCVEIHWERQDIITSSTSDTDKTEFYTTVESLHQFSNAFPELVNSFMEVKNSKTKKKSKKATPCTQEGKETDVDSLTDAVSKISLTEPIRATDELLIVTELKDKELKKHSNGIGLLSHMIETDAKAPHGVTIPVGQSKKMYSKKDICVPKPRYTNEVALSVLRGESTVFDNVKSEDITSGTKQQQCITVNSLRDSYNLKTAKSNVNGKISKSQTTKVSKLDDKKKNEVFSANLKCSASDSPQNDIRGIPDSINLEMDLENSWFESIFLEMESDIKKRRDNKNKIAKGVNKNDKKKTLKCKKRLASNPDTKNEIRTEQHKVEGVADHEILPLCERLMRKSVVKKESHDKKEKLKDVKNVQAFRETEVTSDMSDNVNAFKQVEEKNHAPSNSPDMKKGKKISTESCNGDTSCFSEKRLLKSSDLTGETAISSNSGKLTLQQNLGKRGCLKDSPTSLDLSESFHCLSLTSPDERLSNQKEISYKAKQGELHDVSIHGQIKKEISYKAKQGELPDVSIHGQIQKDFPGLFDCTLPSLLTGGELVSPASDDGKSRSLLKDPCITSLITDDQDTCQTVPVSYQVTKTSQSETVSNIQQTKYHERATNKLKQTVKNIMYPVQSANYPEPVTSMPCPKPAKTTTIIQQSQVICSRKTDHLKETKREEISHIPNVYSPEPVSLEDRLKQRLQKCKDVQTLQTMVTMKNVLKAQQKN
ncbi:uncharacterized protein [Antedon mediterranea]|uniref:uncharacterized protein n=1 Tax=Antedon mediterranea TaxID=105859 RepID=UPI003AF8C550